MPFDTLVVGVALFVSTNIDDLVLLAAFFSDPHLSVRHVVIGQFLGIGALVALSAAAALAAVSIPDGWVSLLGLVPFGLGILKLRQLPALRRRRDDSLEGVHARGHALQARTRSQVLAVSAVTITSGGDNLAVYVPVFAADVNALPMFVAIFAVLTGVWCAAGYSLVNNPVVGARVGRYGHVLLPFALIAIGIWVLSGAAPLLR